MSGFTLDGKYSGDFNLWFIPSPANRMLDLPTFDLREATVTGKDGGYYYGRQAGIREFSLECYFEDISIETFESMMRWLYNDKEREQVFDTRPFVYYNVRSWKKPTGKVYLARHEEQLGMTYSGTVTVYFKAYEPFGKMRYMSYDSYDVDGAAMHCGIIATNEMPPSITPTTGSFLVYNPGTQYADAIIRVGGEAPNGQTITNDTTGDVCKIPLLPSGSDYLEINGETGMIRKLPSAPNETAFEYHDMGYVRLAPCTPYMRDVLVSYKSGSNTITFTTFKLSEENVGQYIRINGEWLRIIAVQGDSIAVVNKNISKDGSALAMIVTMNQITVEGDGAKLNKLEIEYTPKVR